MNTPAYPLPQVNDVPLFERRALVAWLTYFTRTETYDRQLPGAWSPRDSQVWLPYPGYRPRSLAFAGAVHGEVIVPLLRTHLRKDLERAAFERAREQAFDAPYDHQLRWLDHLTKESIDP